MASPSREDLLASAQRFCTDISEKKDVVTLVSHFSKVHEVAAIEYGEAFLAPFLGRSFVGLSGVNKYFETIISLLSYQDMQFSEFLVDSVTRKVATKGRARFTWLSTGECWDETFSYVLDFDEESKLVRYQVWADSGAAHLSSQGKLYETRKKNLIKLSDYQSTV